MMLFRMKSENDRIHWTIIYVIITVTAMLIENIRQVSQSISLLLYSDIEKSDHN